MRIEEARQRYWQEREKRRQAARVSLELTGDLSRYLRDPFTKAMPRPSVREEFDVVVIGAGLAGLQCAGKIRARGTKRLAMIDEAGDFGGVWYWNRYPGAMSDIESYIYMPLLEETGYLPTMKYAMADEIFAHAQRIGRHYGLYDHALFQTKVTRAVWQQADACWVIETDRGDRVRARFVVLANGNYSRPTLPAVPGLGDFKGRSFHTSRWDYSYTGGGNASDLLPGLVDKSVGVVGTGATGIQCVPPLGRSAKQLYVFQRTPSTVGVRGNRPTDERWASTLKPGWTRERRINYASIMEGRPVDADLVNDGWTALTADVLAKGKLAELDEGRRAKRAAEFDLARMNAIRARIEAIVQDSATAEALKPYYPYFCKRPGFHDEYLDTFNRENVQLVDTAGRGIERIVKDGIIANGTLYEVDCIIFATGFDTVPTARKTDADVVGRSGQLLNEKWANGVATLFGIATRGFPNFLFLPLPHSGQGAIGFNYTLMVSEVSDTISHVIDKVQTEGISWFDVSVEAEESWVQEVVKNLPNDREFWEACTPGRRNNEGRLDSIPLQTADYGKGPLTYFDVLRDWRSDGSLTGFEMA